MLYHALQAVAQQHPDRPALYIDEQPVSYAQLWQRVEAGARNLVDHGVEQGDRVAILARNSLDSVLALWSIFRCNAIAVYLNDQLKTEQLRTILDDAEVRLILCASDTRHDALAETHAQAYQDLARVLGTPRNSDDGADSTVIDETNASPELIASIIYTSGSTGTPKGVCLTHANLVSVARMAADGYSTTEHDRYLMVVPLHYIHGLMILFCMHLRGASIEFMNNFMFPGQVTKRLISSEITGFSGVPYHISAMIDRGGLLEADLSKLRWLGVTGGTITPDRLRQIRQGQPDVEIHISYGLTECSPRITQLHPDKIDTKPTSVGYVAEGLTVEFLDEHGQPVPPGEIGELVVSGPNVMHGYWKDPENTAKVIDEQGRLFTGDLAFMDEEGDIFVKGRKQAMIKSAGERIFPEELEKLLAEHPLVADVAVVGVPDALYGQRIEAHIVFDKDIDTTLSPEEVLDQINKFCLGKTPLQRAPRKYHHWAEFPLKANGKTDKQKMMGMTPTQA